MHEQTPETPVDDLQPEGIAPTSDLPAASTTTQDNRLDTAPADIVHAPDYDAIEIEAQRLKNAQARSQREQQRAQTAEVIRSMDIVRDQHGELQIVESGEGAPRVLAIDSQAGRDCLIAQVAQRTGKVPPKEMIEQEVAIVRHRAAHRCRQEQVHLRCAEIDANTIAWDLGDEVGHVIKITPSGVALEHNKSVLFARARNYAALPAPEFPISAAEACETMVRWLTGAGVPHEQALILMVAIVGLLFTQSQQVIAEIVGPAGSSKTTLANQIGAVFDPVTTEKRPEVALKEDQVAALAHTSRILLIDNLSHLSPEQQNLLCKVVLGGVLAARKFFSQADIQQIYARFFVLSTSITPVATQPDAKSRSIRATLKRRTEVSSSAEVRAKFDAQQPQLVGSVAVLAREVLIGRQAMVRIPHAIRIADHIEQGEALMQRLGHPPGYYIDLVQRQRKGSAHELIEGDGFAAAIVDIIKGKIDAVGLEVATAPPPLRTWARAEPPAIATGFAAFVTPHRRKVLCITSTYLLNLVKAQARMQSWSSASSHRSWWPERERQLNDGLNRITPLLKDIGIDADSRDFGGTSGWSFAVSPDE